MLTDQEEAILDGWDDQYDSRSESWEITQVDGSLRARCLIEEDIQSDESENTITLTFPVREMADFPPAENHQLFAGIKGTPSSYLRYRVTRAGYGGVIGRLDLVRV